MGKNESDSGPKAELFSSRILNLRMRIKNPGLKMLVLTYAASFPNQKIKTHFDLKQLNSIILICLYRAWVDGVLMTYLQNGVGGKSGCCCICVR